MNRFETLQPLFTDNLQAARRSVSNEAWAKDSIGVNAVFGISDSELPARFLAGFIPAMSLTDALSSTNHTTAECRIFVPLHLSTHCGIKPTTANKNTSEGMFFIQKFQETFHPSIQWFLDIDQPLKTDAINMLMQLSDTLLNNNEALSAEWSKVFSSAKKRGNENTARIYGPHHVFGWQDAYEPNNFFTGKPKWLTINCVSASEKPFQIIRKNTVAILKKEKPHLIVCGDHIDLTTKMCRRPHYLLVQVGNKREPTMNDLLTLGFNKVAQELKELTHVGEKFRNAHRDLMLIQNHVNKKHEENNELPDIEDFVTDLRI